jgi:preprotein translocase subunit SecG
MTLLTVILYILFILAAIVLVVVVLLQEGRGGGFGEALGSHGRETFGVGSKGINTFTGWTAAVFLGCALALHYMNRRMGGGIDLNKAAGRPEQQAPAGDSTGAPVQIPAPANNAPTKGTPPAQGGNGK